MSIKSIISTLFSSCEHDWHNTGVSQNGYYSYDRRTWIYCPKCKVKKLVKDREIELYNSIEKIEQKHAANQKES